ncbi:hypothetical protein H1R20_g1005, partial [Candolleomyces eurysporus]
MLVARDEEGPGFSGGHVGSLDLQANTGDSDTGGWIPIRRELVVGLLQRLTKRPGMPAELIEGGKEGQDSAPLYIARAVTELPITFEVLAGSPADYSWQPVTDAFELSKIDDLSPVLGGHQLPGGEGELRLLYIARTLTVDGGVHLGYVSIGNNASIRYEGGVVVASYYEVLVHNNSNSNAVRALVGTYETDGDWTRTKEAERYSEAINFSYHPWQTVPRIALGLTMLDIGWNHGTPIRVESFTQNITKEGFICGTRSWGNGILHNAVVDWIAIEHPSWQCGVFNSQDVKLSDELEMSSEHRVNFSKPFEDGPPMVFVCFSGLHVMGKWNVRVYATNIDPAGFTVAIVSCGEEDNGPPVKLRSAAITWIAVPGSDVTKKKNVWIGSFATGRKAGGLNECNGHVDFGFVFKRTPKIFVGLRQFSASKDRNLRVRVKTSNVTTKGMDWRIEKWDDTVLFSATLTSAMDVDRAEPSGQPLVARDKVDSHRLTLFEDGSPPTTDEHQLFTWRDATLRELLTTLRNTSPNIAEFRHPLARFSFRTVYADSANKGRFASKDLVDPDVDDDENGGSSSDDPTKKDEENAAKNTREQELKHLFTQREKEERTLEELRFVPGDYLLVSVILPKGVSTAQGELNIKGTAAGVGGASTLSPNTPTAPAASWKVAGGDRDRDRDRPPRGGNGHWRGGSDGPAARGGLGGRGFGGRDRGAGGDRDRDRDRDRERDRDRDVDRDRRVPPPRRFDASPPPRGGGGWGSRGGGAGGRNRDRDRDRSRSRSRSPPRRRRYD